MKVNQKKANSKGKGIVKPTPGTQTITSMFKKQIASSIEKTSNCSPAKTLSSDDDVMIVKVETESSYFQKGSCDGCEGNRVQTKRRLSLKKSASAGSSTSHTKTDVKYSGKVSENTGSTEIPSLTEPYCLDKISDKSKTDGSVRKLNSKKPNTVMSSEDKDIVTGEDGDGLGEVTDDNVNESSQKENQNTSGSSKQTKRMLNLRKRKSDTLLEEESSKMSKTEKEAENSHMDKSQDQHSCSHDKHNSENQVLDDGTKCIKIKITAESGGQGECSLENKDPSGRRDIKTEYGHMLNTQPFQSVKEEPWTSKSQNHKLVKSNSSESSVVDESSQQNEDIDIDEDKSSEFRTPYYLENFRTVLSTVFEDENNIKLYDREDMEVISTFNELSETAQKLYLRLFCRKWVWLPLSKIKYPRIAEDLEPVVEELVKTKMLTEDKELKDLKIALKLLSGGDTKTLAKLYHMNTASQNKVDITDLLIKKTKQNTIGSMFKVAGSSPETLMLNRAKKLLGTCICVAEEPRKVFARTLMLFSLTDTVLDEDSSGQSLQLFQMLRVNIGQVTYPKFTVNKQTKIFLDREALLRFCEASLLEFDILTKIERNKYADAFTIYEEAVRQYDNLTKNKCIIKFDKKLPVFLRPYTACGVYTRVFNQGVEILQRRKDYPAAVDLLKKLLSQGCYCQHYRGHWWERLALNYDIHLKKQDLALKAVQDGLNDKLCKTGRRLALYQRAEKICTTAKSKFKSRMKDFHHEKLLELPVVTIEGQTLSDNIEGQKYKFMIQYSQGNSQTDTDDIAFCCVEEVVLDHYKHNGFPDGIHAEGSVISILFGLFFWDIMFMDVPDVFHSPYQTHPLDLHREEFYFNRQRHIDDRLDLIQKSSNEELNDIVAKTWEEHEGTLCAGLNWERFNNLQHVQGLVECIGGKTLSGILGRYAKDPRHTRSGFPDLTLWNTETKVFKICEVKGPGDKLSHKQIMWLDYLLKLGVDAEVCHVKAVGSKKLKKIPSTI